MTLSASFPTVILSVALAFSLPMSAADPAPPVAQQNPAGLLTWANKQTGSTVVGRFVRMEGDNAVIIDQKGQKWDLPTALMTEESARQARNLAAMAARPAPEIAAKPLQMRFLKIGISRLPNEPGKLPDIMKPTPKKYQFMRFKMGSPATETGRGDNEPQHFVRLSRDFMLKDTEVTSSEWNTARDFGMKNGYTDLSPGSNGQGGDATGNHPVLGITWWDAIKWCNIVSQMENRKPVYYTQQDFAPGSKLMIGTPALFADWSADGYRLPTEAEWEFACRSGTSEDAFHPGPHLDDAGWFSGNSGGVTHPVGTKKPTRFGLLDMHGNAAEWCWDIYGPLSPGEVTDPLGPDIGELRVIRGGSWSDPAKSCRAASREGRNPGTMPNPTVGFRPVRMAGKADIEGKK